MKIGLIADIHGNLQAMNAVLEALYREQVDLILCAGDLVCYGAQCNYVIDLMRACNIPSVCGNYDAAVAWNLPTASSKPSSPETEALKQAALRWTQQHIHSKHRDYLRTLPWTMRFLLDDIRITVLHAGLEQLDEWYTPDDPNGLVRLARCLTSDIVVLGHTHQSFDYTVEYTAADGHSQCRTRFVNPGAIGRALDGDTARPMPFWTR
ncbi:MAG: metallophosphoesterase family protein [Caldilineaceae bacterium]